MESASTWRTPLTFVALALSALMASSVSAGALPEADLSATVDDGLNSVDSGDDVTYTMVVANAGPDDVTGASFTNSLSAGLSCTWTCSASAGSSCTASGSGQITDSVDILSGGDLTYTANCTVSASGGATITNTVTITEPAGTTDPNAANNSATDSTNVVDPVVEADLSITVSDGLAEATSGEDITYTLLVANAGPNDVSAATVSNTFSAWLSCSWTCNASAGSSCSATGTGDIADSVDLLSGGTLTYSANCNVTATDGDTVTSNATITAPTGITDNSAGNNSAADSTSVVAARLPGEPIPALGFWGLIMLAAGVLGLGLRHSAQAKRT